MKWRERRDGKQVQVKRRIGPAHLVPASGKEGPRRQTDKLFRSPPDGFGLFKPRFFADNFTAEGLPAGDKNCETR